MSAPDVVDWDLAVTVGGRFSGGGPDIGTQQSFEAVAQLRELAAVAVAPVRERTGLVADETGAVTVVVDRGTWITSNVEGFRVVTEPLLTRLRERHESSSVITSVGARLTGVQLGVVLGYLSGKVLGQFEAFAATADSPGRLLLVAPNIVATERALEVTPRDFRLWVCLHEETHRVQFGAVPWLGPHLVSLIHGYLALTDTDAGAVLRQLRTGLGALAGSMRSGSAASSATLLELAQTPDQRQLFDQMTAVMSLLEGHADYVMDDVGPQVVPSVAVIRERFQVRRNSPGAIDGLARRLLGLDAKLAQYADGAAFVRGVVERAGREGFNQVWAQPANLPDRDEIADPGAWCRRVLDTA